MINGPAVSNPALKSKALTKTGSILHYKVLRDSPSNESNEMNFISSRNFIKQLADQAKENPRRIMNDMHSDLDKDQFLEFAWNAYADNIYRAAKRYSTNEIPFEDFFQESYIALLRAYENYNPSIGSSFYNYFRRYITSVNRRYKQNHKATIRIPVHQQEELSSLERDYDEQLLLEGDTYVDIESEEYILWKTNYISFEELYCFESDFESIDRDPVRASISSFFSSATHYFPTLFNERIDEFNDLDLDHESTNFDGLLYFDDYRISDASFLNQLWKLLDKGARSIPPSKVLKYRYGFNKKNKAHTLQEIGDKFGVTRERIRQIERRALDNLKEYFEQRKYELEDFV